MANLKMHRYTAGDVEKVVKMKDKGFKAKEIASIIGVSERSAATYIAIIDNLSSGIPISFNKHTYSESVVKEYCENHGIEYRHVSDEQKPEREPDGAGEQLPGQMSVEDTELDAQIAVFKREEQRLMKAICSYVCELIKTELIKETRNEITC